MERFKGVVVKNTGSIYVTEEITTGKSFHCRLKGKLRLKGVRTTNPVSVGDIVYFEKEETGEDVGVITEIEQRRNYIIRRSTNLSRESHIIAANIDNVFLVATLDFPLTSTEFIDRFLITCELYKVPVTIVLNKCDLFPYDVFKEVVDDFHNMYKGASYRVINVSALTGEGVDQICELMSGAVSLFAGNSGVGKSTLIKAIAPDMDIRVGEISDYHQRGKHTTTFSQMFKLGDCTYLIDTPGIKGFGLVDVKNEELARYMPDLFAFSPNCQFANCTHTHEPNCAVKEAALCGKINAERYDSYLKILDDDGKYRR